MTRPVYSIKAQRHGTNHFAVIRYLGDVGVCVAWFHELNEAEKYIVAMEKFH
jgi:hypothetical protein